MYSQYIDGKFSPFDPRPNAPHRSFTPGTSKQNPIHGEILNSFSQIFSGISKSFSLNQLDSGDILLILIILFLFLEGDNLELVITLGLMLLLSLRDD